MLRRKGRERARLYVTDWRVGCPRRGDVELDECMACGYLDVLDDAAPPRYIQCRWLSQDLAGLADRSASLNRQP